MPPPEPTTSPSVDLEAIAEELDTVDNLFAANEMLRCDNARLQAQVASMREVVEAVIDKYDSRDVSPTPDQRDVLDDLRSALRRRARLDATPQPRGDGQTREEAGR